MKHLLLALLLITPSAVRAEPLWAFVFSDENIRHGSSHYVDLNSFKTLGQVTYFNKKTASIHDSFTETHQVNCPEKKYLYNSNIEGAKVFWGEWKYRPGFNDRHKKLAEFVCDAISKL